MSNYVYGKDIIRKFFPIENGVPLALFSQSPTIHIFSDKPSRSAAIAGTDALQTVTSWTEYKFSPYERRYTVTAIADPDPTSTTLWDRYWEAIRFFTKSGGQAQTIIRSFIVERIEGSDEVPGTTVADLKKVYPGITAYADDPQLFESIGLAESELKRYFRAKGIKWSRVSDLSQVRLPLAYKALALCAFSQVKEDNDRFHLRFNQFEAWYKEALGAIALPVDEDGDGEPEAIVTAKPTFWQIER